MKEGVVRAAPVVQHGLSGRLAIDIHQHRILLRGIKIARLDHPGVHHHAAADVELEELGGPREEWLEPGGQSGVVLQHADAPVFRQLHQIGHRRLVEGGIGVERPTAVGRKHIAVRAGLIRRRQPFGRAGSIEARAVKVALRRVGRRGEVVKPSVLVIHLAARDEVAARCGDRRHLEPSRETT